MSQDDKIGEVSGAPLARAVSERYLNYALSTIMHRALPDARDGLKPVHRRILYAMHGLRLASGGAFRKSAKITGDVMGNYHPHGDSAIYDAMVRLAQDFSMRLPLVDGQGNFGTIDGDSAAAARYTEARMTRGAEMLLEGIGGDAVVMNPNYDGTLQEPDVLPASFPNILVNGSTGIAVGMATNIPPHDPHEAIDACIAMIKNPEIDTAELCEIIKGPDFPTGGIFLNDPLATRHTYETGRGFFRLRAKWEIEDQGKAGRVIIVTEIPYGVQKLKLVEKIGELIDSKKIPILADVRDESTEDIRIVLEPKSKSVDPAQLMAALYKLCDLEVRFGLNMNVLTPGRVPKVCSLREVIKIFLDHRDDVLLRRSESRLKDVDARLEILAGLLIAYLNLDEVIRIIREDDDPDQSLMRAFDLSERQAEAILAMRLRNLRKLEEEEIRKEQKKLEEEKSKLERLIASKSAREKELIKELMETKKSLGEPARRTAIELASEVEDAPVTVEAFIEREPIVVIVSTMGWIRSVKGKSVVAEDLKFKDGDSLLLTVPCETTSNLLLFADDGQVYTLKASEILGGRGFGGPLRLLANLPQDATIVSMRPARDEGASLLVSGKGLGFILKDEDALAFTKNGKKVMNFEEGDKLFYVRDTAEGDSVLSLANDGRLLIFALDEIPQMAKGKGVWIQRGSGITEIKRLEIIKAAEGLTWNSKGKQQSAPVDEWKGKRAGAGKKAPF